jgi:hypothetical protein
MRAELRLVNWTVSGLLSLLKAGVDSNRKQGSVMRKKTGT